MIMVAAFVADPAEPAERVGLFPLVTGPAGESERSGDQNE
jgi:hypothetical protein